MSGAPPGGRLSAVGRTVIVVVSSDSQAPTASSVDFTVTFDEDVQNFGGTDLAVTTTSGTARRTHRDSSTETGHTRVIHNE